MPGSVAAEIGMAIAPAARSKVSDPGKPRAAMPTS